METTDASNAVGEHGKHGTIFPGRISAVINLKIRKRHSQSVTTRGRGSVYCTASNGAYRRPVTAVRTTSTCAMDVLRRRVAEPTRLAEPA